MEREQTTIRLPVDLKAEIQKQADCMGISFNEFIIIAVNDLLNRQN